MKTDTPLIVTHSVQIEVDVEKLTSLFISGVLCAADVRCLNRASKDRVWELCLKSCFNGCAKKAKCSLIPKRSISYLSRMALS